jgi:hypothetical protein
MYSIDANTQAALERQAYQVRAVQAYGSDPAPTLVTEADQKNPALRQTALLLATAAPLVLLAVWGLLVR